MAKLQILGIFVFAAVVSSEILVYRKYHRYPPNKNYTEVFEIFGTKAQPPPHIGSEGELNNFLARDAYKTDMNCSKVDGKPDVELATRPTTTSTTLFPEIPIQRRTVATTTRRSTTTPNLTNLFRLTKPTIKPNPKENLNPDYNDLGASSPTKKPSVQVTKHPSSTSATTIVIKESDDPSTTNRNPWVEVDEEWSRTGNTTQRPTRATTQKSVPTTTVFTLFPWATRASTTTPTTTTTEDSEIIYPDEDPVYDGENYEVLTSEEKDREQRNRGDIEGDDEANYDGDDDAEYENEEDNFEPGQRKRRKSKRVAALQAKPHHVDIWARSSLPEE